METVAAAELLKEGAPGLKIRVVNVVDLMRLQDANEHPHGLSARDFDGIFTADKPIIFAYHGYPSLIHRLAYRRTNQEGLHVRGYKEEGTTTTPFDMAMLNGIDRFQLAIDAIDRPWLGRAPLAAPPVAAGCPDQGPEPHARPRRGPGGDPRLVAQRAAQPGITWGTPVLAPGQVFEASIGRWIQPSLAARAA
ncbi:probable phosphoketolase 1 [Arthrobacter sp. Hiyo6]|nr:probable phosphoketolase 1 [Arthrobacter sp. Hiyo6]